MRSNDYRMRNFNLFKNIKSYLKLATFICLLGFTMYALADNGRDYLQGTDASFWATLNGTGRKYIYGIEFIIAIGSYIKSKNLLVFLGIIAIAVFFNIMLKFISG